MKIQDYLSEKGVAFSVHDHAPAYTAQEVAAEEHITGKKLAKPVIVRTDQGYAMCVLPAHLKLDLNKAADALEAESIRLAAESELAEMFPGSEVGAETPLGNLYDLPTIIDPHLAHDDEIVFQAENHRQAIHMQYRDYESVVQPRVMDIAIGG